MKISLYLSISVSLLIAQAAQADICTWLGGNGDWDDSAKWSCGVVPDADDDVIIDLTSTITKTSPVTIQSLTITGSAVLDINGDLTITGLFTWETGQIKGSGNTFANGGVIFQGPITKTLKDRSITLNANSTWSGGMIVIPQNHAFTIASGVTFEITGDDILRPQVGNSGILENNGTILKSGGAVTSVEAVDFTNNGNVNINEGTFDIRGCDSDGDFTISWPGVLKFYQNTLDLNAGATISGSGLFQIGTANPTIKIHPASNITCDVEITSGTMNIDQDISIPILTTGTSSSITFTGSAKLTVTETTEWKGGTFKNMPAGVRLEGGIKFLGSIKTIEECEVELAGNTIWGLGQIRLKNNGKLKNICIWIDSITSDNNIQQFPTNAVGAEFINNGTYTKANNSITQINVPFDNNGPIMVNAGTLEIEEGNSNANIAIAANASLAKVGTGATQFSFQGGEISGNGQLSATGGSFLFEPGSNVETNVSVSGTGKTIYCFPDSILSLTMNGGTVQGNGSARLYINGEFKCLSNNNVIQNFDSLIVYGGTTLSSSGSISISDAVFALNSNTTWTSGNIQLQSNGIISNMPGMVFTVNVPSDRSISGAGIGQQFNNSGTLKKLTNNRLIFGSNVSVTNTGLIQGLGIYDFKTTMQNAGTFAPGLSPGEMILAGNIVNNSTMNFELEESGGNTNFDEMPIRGSLSLGGTLDVTTMGIIPDGDYVLIYCDSLTGCLSGTFDQTVLPEGASLEYTPDEVILRMLMPLPVELIDFSGEVTTNGNLLRWTTMNESNTSKFIVERSLDAQLFQAIGSVEAAGYSTSEQYYSFYDKELFQDTYYRLRILDFDGKEELSPIIALQRSQPKITVYPNPFSEYLQVDTGLGTDSFLSIYDLKGTLVWYGRTEESSYFAHLPQGTYMLKIFNTSGELLSSERIIKNR